MTQSGISKPDEWQDYPLLLKTTRIMKKKVLILQLQGVPKVKISFSKPNFIL